MWPLSLLFSSDEQTSRALSQALTELEFEVESCPEIFSAVEKITSRAFEVIVSDWNEGLEAVFLLKTSRELKANHAAFTIAIADSGATKAAREAGADLVLSRPLVPDERSLYRPLYRRDAHRRPQGRNRSRQRSGRS